MSDFVFEDQPVLGPDDFLATLPTGLNGASALLQTLSERLAFPSYFGFNWDALSDCLRDLHWLSQKTIFLVHGDLPTLPEPELRIYLEVLQQAIESWRPDESHNLHVVFPSALRKRVTDLLT